MSKDRRTVGWMIAVDWVLGEPSLYTGFEYSRVKMIAAHVHDKRLHDDPPVSRWPERARGLSPRQRALWKRCKKNGDRCVRVEVKWR